MNEKLIKEAEQRYPDIEANPETFPTGWSREQERNAFIAGAVFEKALGEATVTPTDDEREALIQMLHHRRSQWHVYGSGQNASLADEILETLSRTEVPEPSAEPICTYCGHPEREHPGGAYCPSWSVPEQQGEPSDAQVNAAQDAYYATWGPHDVKMRAALRAAGEVRS